MIERPDLKTFRRVYYDRSLDYWDVADTFGVTRSQVDRWRREFGLPSRRYHGTYRPGKDDEEFDMPAGVCGRDRAAGRVRQWQLWDRRRLPGLGVRIVGAVFFHGEWWCELG